MPSGQSGGANEPVRFSLIQNNSRVAPKRCRKGSVPAGAAHGRAGKSSAPGVRDFLLSPAQCCFPELCCPEHLQQQVISTALPAGSEPGFLPFYPNFTLQTSSFNSPTESQAENLHPLLVPRHRGTNLPSWESAQWKETGRDCNVSIKAVKILPGWDVGEFPSLKCSAQVPTLLFPWGFMD